MDFSFDALFAESPIAVASVAAAMVSALYLCTFYRRIISRIRKYAVRNHAEPHDRLPGISVIVYCRDSSDALGNMLPGLLAQDYAGEMEVIVATDGRSLRAEEVVTALSIDHRNLRMTYVPDEAHALSRKKLAVTLGIKAARYDHVLLTEANDRVPSPRWIATMASRLSPERNVVIGACHPEGLNGEQLGGMRAFDTLADTVTYLSAAIAGHPYRANDNNLIFSRQAFFGNKGFADSVGYHYGIDDIFVSRIADAANTAVELGHEASVTRTCYNLNDYYRTEKLHHIFTGHYVSRRERMAMGVGSLMLWVMVAATAHAAISAWPNLLPASAALLFTLTAFIVLSCAWRGAARTLSIVVCPYTLPFMMLLRPLHGLIWKFRARLSRSLNYTWTKLK